MIRILICGSRDFQDRHKLYAFMDKFLRERQIMHEHLTIIHGDAAGADRLGRDYGNSIGCEVLAFPADWDDLSQPDCRLQYTRTGKPYDANAGSRRNAQMLREGKPDFVVAFPGGHGTANMVKQTKAAIKAGAKIEIVEVK